MSVFTGELPYKFPEASKTGEIQTIPFRFILGGRIVVFLAEVDIASRETNSYLFLCPFYTKTYGDIWLFCAKER